MQDEELTGSCYDATKGRAATCDSRLAAVSSPAATWQPTPESVSARDETQRLVSRTHGRMVCGVVNAKPTEAKRDAASPPPGGGGGLSQAFSTR